jgi:hypothetical protein
VSIFLVTNMRRRLAYCFLLVLLMLAGCAKRPASTWRVITAPAPQLLVPPRPDAPAALGKDALVFSRARSLSPRRTDCAVRLPGFSLDWKGRTARVEVDTAALLPSAARVETTMPDGARRILPGVSFEKNWFQLLPASLDSKSASGCLSAGDARVLPARLAANLTLPPPVSWRLLHGDPTITGYIDVEPGFVLKSITPVRDDGQVSGYLTSTYLTRPAGRGGVLVTPGPAETNRRGAITRGIAPDHPVLHLPRHATRLRLFLRSWSITQDRRIALVAAPDVALLDRATREFETDPDGFCRAAASQGVACVSIEKDSVLHAEVGVTAKGVPLHLQAGSTLGAALRALGMKPDDSLPPSLTIHRPWNGELLPIAFPKDPAMLSFILWNGDVMSW